MLPQVTDGRMWSTIRWLYMGSGVLFLANISLGIVNVFSPATISRGQILSHFHAGTIGWVTLSVIATTLWVFTAGRPVSDRLVRFAQALTVVGLLAVAGYIAAFGLAFDGHAPFWMLPLFGIPAALTIYCAFGFAASQLRRQAVVTTVHLLLFGALLVASLGATMGVLRGISLETGANPYPDREGVDPLGAHAAPMDMYLALAFGAFVEMLLRRDATRWTKPGMAQMVLGVSSAAIAAASLYIGIPAIVPASLLLFLVASGFYVARIGWRTFLVNPFGPGSAAGIFWGGLFFLLFPILFVVLVAVYFIPGVAPPHWLGVLFVHFTFVGAATNLLLAVQSSYTEGSPTLRRAQPWAFWVLNLGMLAFVALVWQAGRREGAILMALGVVASLLIVWARLAKASPPATT